MKKTVLVIAAFLMLASSAFARHMAVYEDTGTNIPESSPHLLMKFY